MSNTYNNRQAHPALRWSKRPNPNLEPLLRFPPARRGCSSPCSFSAYSSGDNGNVFQIVNNVDSTRSTIFAYDALNRISQANTFNTNSANCWGEAYTIDAWGNLTNRAGVPAWGGCTTEGLNATATSKNQLNGIGLLYDAAGNVTNDGNGHTPTYDAANEIATDAGVTYSYDADGMRMEKSSGTKYWFGPGGEVLTETDLSGIINEEYIYFNGARIARVDRPSGTVHYYFSDRLGTASVITNASGTSPAANYYFPYGGLQSSTGSDPNHYKFTGKERDAESGLDDFVARYYSSAAGRFLIPDWSAGEDPVPYAELGSPQTLNLYSYVWNNPVNKIDPTGHCTVDGENHGSVWCWLHKHHLFGVETEHEQANDLRRAILQYESDHGQIYKNGKRVDWVKLSDNDVFETYGSFVMAKISGNVLLSAPQRAFSQRRMLRIRSCKRLLTNSINRPINFQAGPPAPFAMNGVQVICCRLRVMNKRRVT